MKITQSLIKKMLESDVCPRAIMYEFRDGVEQDPTDAMLKGQYFEYHLLGGCRGGKEPVLPARKTKNEFGDYRCAAQVELDALIPYAKEVLDTLGIAIEQVQVRLETDVYAGTIDLIGPDIQDPSKSAIYDVKYTDTPIDDRWNGWANVEYKQDAKIQAAHYTMLGEHAFGYTPRFYFLVFGKSKWVRVIEMALTDEARETHTSLILAAGDKISEYHNNGWPAYPEFNKCITCFYSDRCESKSPKPQIEHYEI